MRRVLVVLCVAMAASLCAAQTDFSKVQVKIQKVSGNVYMLQGAGGNITASVGDDGIVMVDDEFIPLAEKIQAQLKTVSDKLVRFVIITHYHFDHTSGDPYWGKIATLIAQQNVRKRLAEGGPTGYITKVIHENKPAAPDMLPQMTFTKEVDLHMNGDDIKVVHYPHAHTDGDSVVFFPKEHVVATGDTFVTYGFPFIDLNAGGSVEGTIAEFKSMIPKLPADVKIIPGHGNLSNLDDLKNYVKMLEETTATIRKAMQEGKTLEEMKQEKIMEPWQKWSGNFINSDAWIDTVYNELTAKKH